jgi:hypothetical protein
MELSLAGLIGAVAGTVASALVYGRLVNAVEGAVRKWRANTDDQATFDQELALLRRGVFAADMLLLAGLGYWLGQKIGG